MLNKKNKQQETSKASLFLKHKNMTKLKLLPFLLTYCLSINAQSWEKVYQNDENGKSLFGDKVALIEAIRSGKDVKIMVKNENFEYYTPAENIWIKNGTVTIIIGISKALIKSAHKYSSVAGAKSPPAPSTSVTSFS